MHILLPPCFAYANLNTGSKRLASEVVRCQHMCTKSPSFTAKPGAGFSGEDPHSTPGKGSTLPTNRPPCPSSSSYSPCRRTRATRWGVAAPRQSPAQGRKRHFSPVQHPSITKEDEWVHPGGSSTAKNRWSSVWTCFLDSEASWKIFNQIFFLIIIFFKNPTSLFKLPKNQPILFWEATMSCRSELLFPQLTKISSKLRQSPPKPTQATQPLQFWCRDEAKHQRPGKRWKKENLLQSW